MINIKKVSKIYQTKDIWGKVISQNVVFEDLSISIADIGVVGIFGLNGSGKSTLIKILTGLISPSSGEVLVLGENPFKKNMDFLKRIALYMSKSSQMDTELNAESHFKMVKSIYGINDKKYLSMINFLNKTLKIDQKILQKEVKKLSFGQRAYLEIAGLFISYPKVIFLDEPFVGIDEKNKKKLMNLMRVYCRENKSLIVLTSSNMKEIEAISKATIILNKSRKKGVSLD